MYLHTSLRILILLYAFKRDHIYIPKYLALSVCNISNIWCLPFVVWNYFELPNNNYQCHTLNVIYFASGITKSILSWNTVTAGDMTSWSIFHHFIKDLDLCLKYCYLIVLLIRLKIAIFDKKNHCHHHCHYHCRCYCHHYCNSYYHPYILFCGTLHCISGPTWQSDRPTCIARPIMQWMAISSKGMLFHLRRVSDLFSD